MVKEVNVDVDISREDLMFLRNLIHGAPISAVRIATKLQKIDTLLNTTASKERQIHKSREYYERVAARIHKLPDFP